jgi:hypothetical protein
MAALKLFISHSSRLRPASADDAEAQANWQLLQDTCKGLNTEYGDKIEILVDYEGLHPGDDWERRLNEWLAECHAAIILFSRRAIEESNWVRKEAAILSWRAELEPEFRLFPVLLDQQATPADLEKDFLGTLRITRTQCVAQVSTAAQILGGIRQKMGDHPELLRGSVATPFERLLEAVESVIVEQVKLSSLERLWQTLFPGTTQPSTRAAYARALARHLLNDGQKSLERFQAVLNDTLPHPSRERAEELLKFVRALWVGAGEAGQIPAARSHGKCLALNGQCLELSQPELGTRHFTLDRYLERAWPGANQIRVIPISDVSSPDAIQAEIRKTYARGLGHLTNEVIDRRVREDKWHVVIFVPSTAWAGEVPDARLVDGLQRLQQLYATPVFVFGVGERMRDDLPDGVKTVDPELCLQMESDQLLAELDARELLTRIYG